METSQFRQHADAASADPEGRTCRKRLLEEMREFTRQSLVLDRRAELARDRFKRAELQSEGMAVQRLILALKDRLRER
jgi:hypothetical protein